MICSRRTSRQSSSVERRSTVAAVVTEGPTSRDPLARTMWKASWVSRGSTKASRVPRADLVASGDLGHGVSSCANLGDLFLGKLARLAALGVAILHVVRVSAKEEVVFTNARWLIAAVENVQAVWNRPVALLPGNAVRATTAAILPGAPVPITVGSAQPDVTGSRIAPILHLEPSLAVVMPKHEASRFALHRPSVGVRPLRNRSWLAAATLAELRHGAGV